MSDAEKQCMACLRVKPAADFYRDSHNKTGLRSWCRACTKKRRGTYPVLTHGYGGYSQGCRCGICTKAKADYMAARRSRAVQDGYVVPEGITHGTRSAYEEHGCRCVDCVRHQYSCSRHPETATA